MKEQDNKKYFANQIIYTAEQLSKKFSDENDEEKAWLIKTVGSVELKDMLPNMTVLMLHVLDAIGTYEPVNGITISEEMEIPKGTVSKITRKLIECNLVKKEKKPDNKKEILFQTTTLGHELFIAHQQLHTKIEENVYKFLGEYKTSELEFAAKFLKDVLKGNWID